MLVALAKWIRACGPESEDDRGALCKDHFPAKASGRDIVGRQGMLIATAADCATAEEMTRRLNEAEWRRQEDRWAL